MLGELPQPSPAQAWETLPHGSQRLASLLQCGLSRCPYRSQFEAGPIPWPWQWAQEVCARGRRPAHPQGRAVTLLPAPRTREQSKARNKAKLVLHET